jgi:hypothetical protein
MPPGLTVRWAPANCNASGLNSGLKQMSTANPLKTRPLKLQINRKKKLQTLFCFREFTPIQPVVVRMDRRPYLSLRPQSFCSHPAPLEPQELTRVMIRLFSEVYNELGMTAASTAAPNRKRMLFTKKKGKFCVPPGKSAAQ